MPAPVQKDFAAAVNAGLKKWDNYTSAQLARIQSQLKEYQQEILATVASTDWKKARLESLDQALAEAQQNVNRKLVGTWNTQAGTITTLALGEIDGPLDVLGLKAGQLHGMIPIQEIAVLNEYVPSQIVNVTAEVHQKVRGLMRQAALGGISGAELVAKVGNVVGPLKPGKERPAGTVFSAADVRARVIMRTEMNRLHNLVKTSRVLEVSEKYPGVGYKWLHRRSVSPRENHSALDQTVIFPAHDERFTVGGIKVMGPHDPQLPAEEVINCNCTAVVVYDTEKGQKAVEDSPYVAGDGSQIPSVGMPKPKPAPPAPPPPPPPPPGPRPLFDAAQAADPMVSAAHKAGLAQWETIKDAKAAQQAYVEAYKDSVMEAAKKAAQAAEHANTGIDAKIAYHQAKVSAFERAGIQEFLAVEKPKLENFLAQKLQEANQAKIVAAKTSANETWTKIQAMDLDKEFDAAVNAGFGHEEMVALADDLNRLSIFQHQAVTAANKYAIEHGAELDGVISRLNAQLAKIAEAKKAAKAAEFAAKQAAQDALTKPRLWNDLAELEKLPSAQLGGFLKDMTPVQKVVHYEEKIAAAKRDLLKPIYQRQRYQDELHDAIAKAEKALAAARADAQWYIDTLAGVELSQGEIEVLLGMKRLEVRAWLKAKKSGEAPPLVTRTPFKNRGADYETLRKNAGINYVEDESAAARYFDKMPDPTRNMTGDHKAGLQGYQYGPWQSMQALLRKGAEVDQYVRKLVKDGIDAFNYNTWRAPADMVVRRGITDELRHFESFIGDKLGNLDRIVGTVISDPGFVSTSVGAGWAKEYACEIIIPKGANVIPLRWTGHLVNEKEILLRPGQEFFVHSYKRTGNKTILYLELIP